MKKKGTLRVGVWPLILCLLYGMLFAGCEASAQFSPQAGKEDSAGEDQTPPKPEDGSAYADVTSTKELLRVHDTVITAQYEKNSDPYCEGDRWYVTTTYTVQESLRGDLQPGETVSLCEPLDSETASPYSRVVNAAGTDSTLLFLQREEGGYRISTPVLSMQPVAWNEQTQKREILWLNGAGKRQIGESGTVVYAKKRTGTADPYENVLGSFETEKMDPTLCYADTMNVLYNFLSVEDGKTVPGMVDGCRIIALVEIESASDAYQEDGRWYRNLNAWVETVYKDPDQVLTGKTCTIKAEVGSPNEPAPGKSLYVALLREEDEELFLQENLYRSLPVVNTEAQVGLKEGEILWFGSRSRESVNQGLAVTADLAAYCGEKADGEKDADEVLGEEISP